jgi:hypothetical protein
VTYRCHESHLAGKIASFVDPQKTVLKIIFGLREENLQDQTGLPNNFSLGVFGVFQVFEKFVFLKFSC